MKTLLPIGYQKVPGEDFVAVSKSGDVINYHTNLPIMVQQDDVNGAFIHIYEDARPGSLSSRRRLRFVSDMVKDAFGDQSNFEPYEEAPIPVNHIDPNQYKMTIDITSPAMMLEAMRQIRMGMGQHYFEGPLRTKTLTDAVDHLIRKLEGVDNGKTRT